MSENSAMSQNTFDPHRVTVGEFISHLVEGEEVGYNVYGEIIKETKEYKCIHKWKGTPYLFYAACGTMGGILAKTDANELKDSKLTSVRSKLLNERINQNEKITICDRKKYLTAFNCADKRSNSSFPITQGDSGESGFLLPTYGGHKQFLENFMKDCSVNANTPIYDYCIKLHPYFRNDDKQKKDAKEFFKMAFNVDVESILIKKQLEYKVKAGIKQIILHGAPGTGKTFTAKQFAKEYVNDVKKVKEQIEVVQFHPTYDYTDFVEGLRPVQLTPDGNPTFVRMDGAFKKFCRKAAKDKSNKYFFIIDEINRGDVSKILGELMFLMNDPKRTHGEGEIDKIHTPYENLPTYHDENGNMKPYANYDGIFADEDGFFIPDNVIIIGTMNDIDRSVDAFDFAFRRRFVFVKADADTEADNSMEKILNCKDKKEDCLKRLRELNKVISVKEGKKLGLSDDYHIGAAYFSGFDGEDFTGLFDNSIEPLIRDLNPQNSK